MNIQRNIQHNMSLYRK